MAVAEKPGDRIVAAQEQLAAELEPLRALPGLRLLLITRSLLRLPGEQLHWLGPLSEEDGARLLRERARALSPGFDADEAALRALSRRLDSLPLALDHVHIESACLVNSQTLMQTIVNDDGRLMEPGQYRVQVTAEDADGNPLITNTQVRGRVTGVRFDNGYPELMIGDRRLRMSDVIEAR